ncbi:MAG: hypothetical protein AAF772_19375, partial [Acidobacteriota bacterium]
DDPQAASAPLVPGASVSAVLAMGDLNLSATGTVTDRRGDRLVAFGHPLLSIGPALLPMATSEVVTVIASRASSFKIANPKAIVGAFDLDREAGARGVVGLEAPLLPVTLQLRGLVEHDHRFAVVDHPTLTTALVTTSVLGALSARSLLFGPQGVDIALTLTLSESLNEPPIVLRERFDGPRAAIEAVVFLQTYLTFLIDGPYGAIALDRIDIALRQDPQPALRTLVAAYADRVRVAPGETVILTLIDAPADAPAEPTRRRTRRLAVDVPTDLPNGRYSLLIGDGTTIDLARQLVRRTAPQTQAQFFASLRTQRDRRQLNVLGLMAAPGRAVAGAALPALPGSVRGVFAGARTTAKAIVGTPLELVIVDEGKATALDEPLEGAVRVDLDVDRALRAVRLER